MAHRNRELMRKACYKRRARGELMRPPNRTARIDSSARVSALCGARPRVSSRRRMGWHATAEDFELRRRTVGIVAESGAARPQYFDPGGCCRQSRGLDARSFRWRELVSCIARQIRDIRGRRMPCFQEPGARSIRVHVDPDIRALRVHPGVDRGRRGRAHWTCWAARHACRTAYDDFPHQLSAVCASA